MKYLLTATVISVGHVYAMPDYRETLQSHQRTLAIRIKLFRE